MSLRSRIALTVGAAIALVVVLTAIFTYVAVRAQLRGEVDDSLRQRVERVGKVRDLRAGPGFQVGRGPGAPRNPGGLATEPPAAARRTPGAAVTEPPAVAPAPVIRQLLAPSPADPFGGAEGFAQLIVDGDVVGRPDATALPVSGAARRVAAEGGSELADMTVDGVHLRVLTQGLGGGAALQVARPLTEIDDQLSRILIALVVIGAIGVCAGVGFGAFLARTALVPVARFTARTESLRADPDLSQRMDVVGNDELARLARSFNATLDELERSIEAQRQLVADASHELRTPIASLRANIQLLGEADRLPADELARMRADILSELDELTALVGDVVELARGAKPPEELDDVRLDEVVRSVVEREGRRVGGRVALALSLEPSVVAGEAARIGRAVSNLVGNAVKWSPPGGVVEVGLADGVVSVRDHGPGFEPADLPHVFERFYRAAAARGTSGSGLGLAIVKQAAEAHGGFVEASNAPGGGALLRVSFGAAVAPAGDAAPPEAAHAPPRADASPRAGAPS